MVWGDALEIFDLMKKKKYYSDSYNFSALISACEKGQQWQKALGLFREIERPSVVTYNATMTALEKKAMEKST